MERILLQELKCPGHCVPYAVELAASLAEAGRRVRLLLNGAVRSRVETEHAEEVALEGLELDFIEPRELEYSAPETAALEVDVALDRIASWRPDRVLLPTADAVISRLADDRPRVAAITDGPLRWELVLHSLPASVPGLRPRALLRWLKSRRAFDRFARARLLTPDPYSGIGPGRRGFSRRTRDALGYLPYTLPRPNRMLDRAEARRRLGLPESGRLLVVPGAIDPRKSVVRLLEARPALAGCLDGLVLAGTVAEVLKPVVANAIEAPGPAIHVIDRFLPGDDFFLPILAADAVWAAYPNWRGLASIQLIAADLGRTALVDRRHQAGVWVAGGGAGCEVVHDSVPDAVARAIDAPPPSDRYRSFIGRLTSTAAREAVLLDGGDLRSLDALEPFGVETRAPAGDAAQS